MKRNYANVKCQLCGLETVTIGMATHLKDTHNLTVESYVQNYEEYRPKFIKYKERASSEFECKICNYRCSSERHLTGHLKSNHKISKSDYIVQYIFNNQIPKCECGCGDDVSIINQRPYYRKFITGHNVYMHIGMTRSKESKLKMRKSAIERIKNKKGVFFGKGVSKEELKIRDFISKNYSGKIIYNDTTLLSGLELDIFLPDLKLAFEINGEVFHSDLYKKKNYHLNKTKECNELGVHLIHIWLSDWYQSEEIIKSIILNQLGSAGERIYARNTEVREIDTKTFNQFLNKNHIQGQSISKIRLGLYFKNELVQVMGFSSLRRATGRYSKNNSYELIRMCNLLNTRVIGGSSKLFKFFIKKYNPDYVLSYANRDWANGNVYSKMGFNFVSYTSPGYFYVKGKRKYHRYKFQKHILVSEGYDPKKTEYEIMVDRGFYRVWDTGNLVYEYHKIV